MISGRSPPLYCTVPARPLIKNIILGSEAQNLIIQGDSVMCMYAIRNSDIQINDVYAANKPNFLGPIIYGTHQFEPQLLVAYILTSGPVLYTYINRHAGTPKPQVRSRNTIRVSRV